MHLDHLNPYALTFLYSFNVDNLYVVLLLLSLPMAKHVCVFCVYIHTYIEYIEYIYIYIRVLLSIEL